MTKEKKEEYAKRQLPQINGIAYRMSKRYKIEQDEILSKLFLRFCEVIDRYEEKKSSIYTYLMHQLRLVHNEIQKEIKIKNNNVTLDVLEYVDFNDNYYKNKFVKIIEFYNSYQTELSERGKIVMEHILNAPIGGVNRTPSYSSVSKYFCKVIGWKNYIFNKTWNEVKTWWLNNNFVYC